MATPRSTFRRELAQLINKYSLENGSDTPDWILADYLADCLIQFNAAVKARAEWYGPAKAEPGQMDTNRISER